MFNISVLYYLKGEIILPRYNLLNDNTTPIWYVNIILQTVIIIASCNIKADCSLGHVFGEWLRFNIYDTCTDNKIDFDTKL